MYLSTFALKYFCLEQNYWHWRLVPNFFFLIIVKLLISYTWTSIGNHCMNVVHPCLPLKIWWHYTYYLLYLYFNRYSILIFRRNYIPTAKLLRVNKLLKWNTQIIKFCRSFLWICRLHRRRQFRNACFNNKCLKPNDDSFNRIFDNIQIIVILSESNV